MGKKKPQRHAAALSQLQHLQERFHHYAQANSNLRHFEVFGYNESKPKTLGRLIGDNAVEGVYLRGNGLIDRSVFHGDLTHFEEFWRLAEQAVDCLDELRPPYVEQLRSTLGPSSLALKLVSCDFDRESLVCEPGGIAEPGEDGRSWWDRDEDKSHRLKSELPRRGMFSHMEDDRVPPSAELWMRILHVLAWHFPTGLLHADWRLVIIQGGEGGNPANVVLRKIEDPPQPPDSNAQEPDRTGKDSPGSPWCEPPEPPYEVDGRQVPCRVDLVADVFTSSVAAIDIILGFPSGIVQKSSSASTQPPADKKKIREDKAAMDQMALGAILLSPPRKSTQSSNLEPMTQKEIGAKLGWGQSKVSREIRKMFGTGGMKKYKATLKSGATLAHSMRLDGQAVEAGFDERENIEFDN